MYRLSGSGDSVIRLSDGAWIPFSFGNSDYGQYITWLEEGNTPEDAIALPSPPDYYAFWEDLLQTSAYSYIRSEASVDLAMNTAATEFIALVGDAKAGRPTVGAIQASIYTILSIGSFTEYQIEEIQGALVAGNLDGVYSLTAP